MSAVLLFALPLCPSRNAARLKSEAKRGRGKVSRGVLDQGSAPVGRCTPGYFHGGPSGLVFLDRGAHPGQNGRDFSFVPPERRGSFLNVEWR